MIDAAILSGVKTALGVTGSYMDSTITVYIAEVMDYMRGAGVSDDVAAASIGVIARGVSDLWNNQSGTGKLSPYFYDRVTQLVLRG